MNNETIYSMIFFNFLDKHNIGYALGGGGARGFAHLGALKALEERNLEPDIIAGTSAGALAGVLYADGFAPDEICDMFKDTKFKQFVELTFPTSGIFRPTGLHNFLKKNLRAKTFGQLQLPFIAVATDWEKASTVNFSKGNKLIESVVASCCVPLIFSPIEIDGQHYVDGGIFKNLPASTIRDKCNIIFGVNVSTIMPSEEKNNLKYIAERTFNMMSISNTLPDKKLCDVLIEVEGIEKYWMFDLSHIDSIFEAGYNSTVEKLKERKATSTVIRSKRFKLLNFKNPI
ncbi:MAG: patatin-like phospholipase family protein [Dysgonamonadaceae bacterium]|nr:patatin-like phospholipase family protein [Dysgonamonadaceae bacterium]MDD4728136.1 patatin-like phospholipase family protein [Dysgonamonadaceae bacterium]